MTRLLRGTDLTSVVLEVTEHTDFDAAALAAALAAPLAALRERGARVALDDVGTGRSGLLRVAVVHPDVLEVDLQLVRGLDHDLVERSVVQFLGECADRLDAWLVAEGVGTAAGLDVLRSTGVPLVQGHLLARPAEGFAPLSLEARRLLAAGAAGRHHPGARDRRARARGRRARARGRGPGGLAPGAGALRPDGVHRRDRPLRGRGGRRGRRAGPGGRAHRAGVGARVGARRRPVPGRPRP
ncbi:EAL domain-containing protein, partial [Kineococcus sp. SYSU DK018]|uniref:EAL domain-containing protein n=1 Tax=Kineococcus sp. SYSU DK018 TaxID=3383139 RepID=UPI003D7E6EA9